MVLDTSSVRENSSSWESRGNISAKSTWVRVWAEYLPLHSLGIGPIKSDKFISNPS